MTAAAPGPTPSDERELDDLLDEIDKLVDHECKKVTARHDATACTTVHTPQIRCVNAHASRGSRPWRIVSMPRNCVVQAQAFWIRP